MRTVILSLYTFRRTVGIGQNGRAPNGLKEQGVRADG